VGFVNAHTGWPALKNQSIHALIISHLAREVLLPAGLLL
jgi:hypothetical protein